MELLELPNTSIHLHRPFFRQSPVPWWRDATNSFSFAISTLITAVCLTPLWFSPVWPLCMLVWIVFVIFAIAHSIVYRHLLAQDAAKQWRNKLNKEVLPEAAMASTFTARVPTGKPRHTP